MPPHAVPSRQPSPQLALMAAYLLGIPLLLPVLTPGLLAYDGARVLQLGLMPLLAALALRAPVPALSLRMAWGAAALATLGVLSSALAANPAMGLREVLNLASLLAVGAVLASQGQQTLELLPKVGALAVAVYAVPVLGMAVLGATEGLPIAADMPLPGFANRRYLNHVQTVALPLAAFGVLQFRSALGRLLTGAGLVASATLLWITLGRGSLFGLAAALLVWGLCWRRGQADARSNLGVLGGSLALGAVLSALLQEWSGGLAQAAGLARDAGPVELASDHSRFSLWIRAWDMATASPWLGVGPMHYAMGNHPKAAHPHNEPLQWLAEWGWPATLLAALLLAMLARAAWRRQRSSAGQQATLGAAVLAAWACVFVDSWFSGLWVMPVSQTWLAALIGFSWAWWVASAPETATAPTPAVRRWHGLPLLLTGALLVQTLPELIRLPEHLQDVKRAFPGDGPRPRFWSHGQIGPANPTTPATTPATPAPHP